MKSWCFTLNNYTPDDLVRLSVLQDGVNYLIFGKEVGESGPHLFGTVCFQSRKRLPQVIAVIGRAHCTVTRYLAQSIQYCKKDGDFMELVVGITPPSPEKNKLQLSRPSSNVTPPPDPRYAYLCTAWCIHAPIDYSDSLIKLRGNPLINYIIYGKDYSVRPSYLRVLVSFKEGKCIGQIRSMFGCGVVAIPAPCHQRAIATIGGRQLCGGSQLFHA